jgi:hypothetical protein
MPHLLATLGYGTGKWTSPSAQNRTAAQSWRGYIVVRFAACLSLIMLSGTLPALADDPGYLPGPWHFRAMSCVDTTVVSVTPRLGTAGQTSYTAADFQQSGVAVTFNTGLGMQPLFAHGLASVVHYQDTTGNAIMAAERRGDKVQVCYLGGPAPTKYCDPDKDDRGRNYRVYDYRQRAQYWGGNEEHDCGGA